MEKIKKSVIKKLVITDTIDNADRIKKAKNIEVLSISNLMGEAIKRISNSHLYLTYSNNFLELLKNLS